MVTLRKYSPSEWYVSYGYSSFQDYDAACDAASPRRSSIYGGTYIPCRESTECCCSVAAGRVQAKVEVEE